MYRKTTQYFQNNNFLASEKYQNFTITVSDAGVTVGDDGRKVVKAGSILDTNGVVVADGTATGILFNDVDVTYGPQPGALMVEGYVLEQRLPVVPTPDTVKTALKKITFR